MKKWLTNIEILNSTWPRLSRFVVLSTVLFQLFSFNNKVLAQAYTGNTQTQSQTNFYSGFTLNYTIGSSYTASSSYFDITFPAGYSVPTTIDPSTILLSSLSNNGDGASGNASSVTVTGQVVRIVTPIPYYNNGPPNDRLNKGTITILSTAKIKNPTTAGTYNLALSSSVEGAFTKTAPSFTITTSSTTISTPSVSPNTSVELRSAKYNVSFTTGQGGYLTTSSTISIIFPVGTTVPNGSISGVTVNSASTTAVGNSGTRTVTIAVPTAIDNQASVQIEIGKSAGVKNPTNGLTNYLNAFTSSETSSIQSSSYSISSADNLSFSDISLSNDTVNAISSYTIEFVVSNTGGLTPGFNDVISLKYPTELSLPGSVLGSDVTVTNITTGFSASPSSVTIAGDSLYFITPLTISSTDEVRVELSTSLNIQNPSNPSSYSFSAATYESGGAIIDAETVSNLFPIIGSNTVLSNFNPTLSSYTNSATGVTYTLSLKTGNYGRLTEGDELLISFPATTAFVATTATVKAAAATISTLSTTATITIPSGVEVSNNETFTIVVTGVTNANADGAYFLQVSSTPESSSVYSTSFNLGSSSVTTVTSSLTASNAVNQAGLYDFTVAGATKLNGGSKSNQNIVVVFPEGTTIPASIANTGVILNTSAAGTGVGSVSVNTSTRTVTVTVSTNNFTFTRIRFQASAGILNPTIPRTAYYTVRLSTSENTVFKESTTYNVIAGTTSVVTNSVTPIPSAINAAAAYGIAFTPGANGKLVGGASAGTSTVTVTFPTTVTVPATMSTSTVKINNLTVSAISVLSSGNGGQLQLSLAGGQTLPASTQANISFTASAGLVNRSTIGTSTVQVKTSNETTNSTATNNLTLTAAATLTVNSLSVSPLTVNANAAFNLNVLIGTTVNIGDNIVLTFPSNSYVPNPFAKQYVLVNGVTPTSNPTVVGNVLTIVSPTTLTASSSYSIQISSLAGLLNPILTGSSYVVQVSTSHESAVSSSTYSISSTSTTVSSSSVSISPSYVPSTAATSYTINFNTGTYGRLLSGTSTITVRFPTGTNYGTLSATVDGIATAVPSRSTNDVTVIVPASASILNSDAVSLVITGITNPTTIGSYSLQVKTSVENTFISSGTYQITNTGSLTINSLTLGDNTVNSATQYTFNVTSAAMVATTDFFTVTFPAGSTLPNSITTPNVTVKVNAGSAVNASNVTVNLLQRTVSVYVPNVVALNDVVEVVFLSSSGVLNPKEPGDYTWAMKSSTQLVDVNSTPVTIAASFATSISNLTVTVNPQVNNAPVNWTWDFTTGSNGAVEPNSGRIFLDFDSSVFTLGVIPTTSIQVLGTNITSVTKVGTVLQILVPNGVTIGNNYAVTVTLTTAAGIQVDPLLSPSIMNGFKKATNVDAPSISASNDYSAYTSSEPTPDPFVGNPLPVELAFFQVKLDEELNKPLLIWSTLTETENYGFTLQRSAKTDSKTERIWKDVAFISGEGHSREKIDYSFTDVSLSIAGSYNYKLIQQDFDGQKSSIAEVEFLFEQPNRLELYQNFPNPFNPTTTIKYDLPGNQKVKLLVYDILGRLVQTVVDEQQLAGRYTVNFNASKLASGIYFARLRTEGSERVIKMTVLK